MDLHLPGGGPVRVLTRPSAERSEPPPRRLLPHFPPHTSEPQSLRAQERGLWHLPTKGHWPAELLQVRRGPARCSEGTEARAGNVL